MDEPKYTYEQWKLLESIITLGDCIKADQIKYDSKKEKSLLLWKKLKTMNVDMEEKSTLWYTLTGTTVNLDIRPK